MFNPPPLVPRTSLITWTDTHLLSQLPLSYYYCSDDNCEAPSPTLLCRTVHHNPHPFLARPELHFIAPGTDVDDHLMQGTPDLGLASGTRAYLGLVAANQVDSVHELCVILLSFWSTLTMPLACGVERDMGMERAGYVLDSCHIRQDEHCDSELVPVGFTPCLPCRSYFKFI